MTFVQSALIVSPRMWNIAESNIRGRKRYSLVLVGKCTSGDSLTGGTYRVALLTRRSNGCVVGSRFDFNSKQIDGLLVLLTGVCGTSI